MSYCINYDYEKTERQIRKAKPFPISCARIREKHEDIALQVGCNCKFKLPPRGYPSPILHAFRDGSSWPVPSNVLPSASIAAGHDIKHSSDIHELAARYVELKRQLAGMEKSLCRVEQEIAANLKQTGANSIETEFGLLEVRERGERVELVIKL